MIHDEHLTGFLFAGLFVCLLPATARADEQGGMGDLRVAILLDASRSDLCPVPAALSVLCEASESELLPPQSI